MANDKFPEEVRYLTDDRDDLDRNELVISWGHNGDWYVSVVPEGEGTMGRAVRLCTSGGASTRCPGLTVAIARAFRAIARVRATPEATDGITLRLDNHDLLLSEALTAEDIRAIGLLGQPGDVQFLRLAAAFKQHKDEVARLQRALRRISEFGHGRENLCERGYTCASMADRALDGEEVAVPSG